MQNWSEVITMVPTALCILFIIISFACYSTVSSLNEKKMGICEKCNIVKENYGKTECTCGGNFVDFDLMKWVDDNKEKK